MENLKVSVIIPVFNGERYIEKCIKRILEEKQYLHEIVIVNDGSTDRTVEILHHFLIEEKVCVISQENKGVSAARNKGIEICSGDWIVFCDVDDEIREGYFADIINEINFRKEADIICYARASVGSEYTDNCETNFDKCETLRMVLEQSDYPLSSDYLLMMVWSKVFKKDFLTKEAVFFDERISLGEDALFMMECTLKSQRVDLIHRGYYVYLPNDDGACKKGGSIKDLSGFIQFENKVNKMKEDYAEFFNNEKTTIALSKYMLRYGNNMCGRVVRGTKGMRLPKRKIAVRQICAELDSYIKVASLKERIMLILKETMTVLYILVEGK